MNIKIHTKKPLLKVIREKCIDCCCGSHKEVKLCEIESCPLLPYKMGTNPFSKRNMTEAQKKETVLRLEQSKQPH